MTGFPKFALLSLALWSVSTQALAEATAAASPAPSSWVVASPRQLRGLDLPTRGADSRGSMDSYMTVTAPFSEEKRTLIHLGRIVASIFETKGGKIDFNYFPGDEATFLEEGEATFVTRATGKVQTFHKGDYVMIPKGWAGTWAFKDFRENAVASPGEWMDTPPRPADAPLLKTRDVVGFDIAKAETGLHPMAAGQGAWRTLSADSLRAALLHDGEPDFYLLSASKTGAGAMKADGCERAFRVFRGTASLADGGQVSETFSTGSVFIIRTGFAGELRYSGDFQAIVGVAAGSVPVDPAKEVLAKLANPPCSAF